MLFISSGSLSRSYNSPAPEISSRVNLAFSVRTQLSRSSTPFLDAPTLHSLSANSLPLYFELFSQNHFQLIQELKNLINEEKNISVLVLGANVDEKDKNPGPIINSLVSKELSNFRIPIMIVPGNFSNEHISLIS